MERLVSLCLMDKHLAFPEGNRFKTRTSHNVIIRVLSHLKDLLVFAFRDYWLFEILSFCLTDLIFVLWHQNSDDTQSNGIQFCTAVPVMLRNIQ